MEVETNEQNRIGLNVIPEEPEVDMNNRESLTTSKFNQE